MVGFDGRRWALDRLRLTVCSVQRTHQNSFLNPGMLPTLVLYLRSCHIGISVQGLLLLQQVPLHRNMGIQPPYAAVVTGIVGAVLDELDELAAVFAALPFLPRPHFIDTLSPEMSRPLAHASAALSADARSLKLTKAHL